MRTRTLFRLNKFHFICTVCICKIFVFHYRVMYYYTVLRAFYLELWRATCLTHAKPHASPLLLTANAAYDAKTYVRLKFVQSTFLTRSLYFWRNLLIDHFNDLSTVRIASFLTDIILIKFRKWVLKLINYTCICDDPIIGNKWRSIN